MRRKPMSIRSKIILALLVPVLAMTALWAFDVQASIADATALRDTYNTRDNVSLPCDRMVAALQSERSRSLEFLAAQAGDVDGLRTQRAATDATIAEFRELSRRYRGPAISADITRARIADLLRTFGSLSRLRSQVDGRGAARTTVLNDYNSIISYVFSVSNAAAASSDPLVERVMRTSVAIRRAGDLLNQEDALMTGVTTAGSFGPGEYRRLIEIVGALRFQIPTAGSTLPGPDQALFKGMLSSPTFVALRAVEDQIIRDGTSGDAVTTTRAQWEAAFTPAVQQLYSFLTDGYDHAVEFARAAANRIMVRFGVSGLLGLLAILGSLFLSVRIGGSAVNRLSVLRTAATDLAHRRLPELVRRLRAGEQIDPDDDVLRLSLGRDEIADVGNALSEVQRSAISSAAGEAALRYDMNRVLVNIARRNQTLIDRQLEALRSYAPGQDGTARAAQLAVRMRRHAEHLVILAGSARSRRGHGPEPLAGIVARAASEVEHGERIEIGAMVDAEVPEPAVADLGHLLAELMENATVFSPPTTTVRVSAHPVAEGVVVEIEDAGLGMSPSALEATNHRLAQPRELDPAESARLGLFVVAVLAAQRGIRVALRPSPAGGITATVMIPLDVTAPAPESRRSDASRLVGMARHSPGR
jgi:signal transduction histidine kinase